MRKQSLELCVLDYYNREMITFASNLMGSDLTTNNTEKPKQATIKKDSSVASTFEVKSTMADLREQCAGLSVTFRQKDNGNISFLKDSRLPEALYKHVASYVRAIPKRGYYIRYVPKANVPAFKQILTKSGIDVTFVGEAVTQ